ncbi:SUR7 protein, partial [Metarhizium majus ARSEF 297]
MGVGRFICVGLPLALTIASIVALLIATLSGVAHNQLWMFRVDVKDMSISPADLVSITNSLGVNPRADKTGNITAADLGLANVYEIDLWGYCYTDSDNKRQCTKAQFDWANSALNTTYIENLGKSAGVQGFKLPDEVKGALKTFRTVAKWTEVAFIVALLALGIQLAVGIFAMCSRVASCLTWLVSGLTSILVGVAAGLSTATASIVVGAIKGSNKLYGIKADIGTRFLATVWIATAFALGAGFFWIFTICCCKPEQRRRGGKRNLDSDDEKLIPNGGAYRPLSHNYEMTSGHNNGGYYNPNQNQQFNGGYSSGPRHPSGHGRTDLAYEPYSHRA